MESDELGIWGVVLGLMEVGCSQSGRSFFSATRTVDTFWLSGFAASWDGGLCVPGAVGLTLESSIHYFLQL